MKHTVITAMTCATVIACAVLLRVERTGAQRHYQLYSIEETSSANGKTVKSVYRVDTVSGKTWRMSSNPVPTTAQDAQHNPVVTWADGWEEMPESPEAAVTKAKAEWQRATSH
jgi:hypothetical protein